MSSPLFEIVESEAIRVFGGGERQIRREESSRRGRARLPLDRLAGDPARYVAA